MGGHVNRNTSTPVGRVTGNHAAAALLWPTRPGRSSGSASKPTNTNHSSKGRQTGVVVPDFVSKPHDYFPSKYGYQDVHTIYDEMRDFFAKKATSTFLTEVATIKFTLMVLKPNCRHPQMVMVCKNMD
jgi:hypothetical protein